MNDSHLPIESGSSGEWRLRIGIFLAMCAAFCLWFGYDGLIGYPRKNLESIRQALPEKPAVLRSNPRVTVEKLDSIMESPHPGGLRADDLVSALGPAALDQPKEYTYIGPRVRAITRLVDQKLVKIEWQPITESQQVDTPNFRVTGDLVEKIMPGLGEQELGRFLGEPSKSDPRRMWFVGPAVYSAFDIDERGMVAGKPTIHKLEPSEGDISIQKGLAGFLAVLTLLVAVKWLRIVRMRVRVDENGLTFNQRLIPWDAMKGLETDQYLDKGWLDLAYTAEGEEQFQRLDSYHINRFREIVSAICERKAFVLPTRAAAESKRDNDDDDSNVV